MDWKKRMATADKSRGMGCFFDCIEENPIGVTILPASLSPPPLAGGGGGGGDGWLLLDLEAYIAGCSNATTAKDYTRAGHEIQATLRVARPPGVARLCVHCPALKAADFGTEPIILAASDGFVVFRAALCRSYHCDEPSLQDYFLYKAPLSRMYGQPSLTRLPQPDPSPSGFARCHVGLVRCDDDSGRDSDSDAPTLRPHRIPQQQQHCVVAGLCISQGARPGDYTQYDLHRFDSREMRWTTEVLQLGPMAPSPGLSCFYHMTHKVVTLGGGIMGWVDLCRGILLCDVLADRPQLHYIPLPETPNDELLSESEASANDFRDLAVGQGGHIRYVEHQTKVRPWSQSNGTYISNDWTLTTWRWKASSPAFPWEGRWERDGNIDGSRILGSLSSLLGHAASLPPLQQLHTGHPTLSLDNDDVVYVMGKVDHRDDKASVFAVDIRDGVLQAADYFGAERMVGINFTYTQYMPSDYPNNTPDKMAKKKRGPGLLPASSKTKKRGLEMSRAMLDFGLGYLGM